MLLHVTPLDDHLLLVQTEDGKEGVFDVKPYLDTEAFRPLKNYSEFGSVQNGGYFVEWPCGADLSADTLAARIQDASPYHAQLEHQPERMRRAVLDVRSHIQTTATVGKS